MKNNMTTFYLVRHGQSQANVDRIVQGPSVDTHLTEKGRKQAEELAETLADIHFDAIYSSDTVRSKETAEIINKRFHSPLLTNATIRERSFGNYVGTNVEAFLAKYKNFDAMSTDEKLAYQIDENEESNLSGLKRLSSFLTAVAGENPEKTILVVTHEGLIRSFLIYNKQGDFDTIGGLDNCGYVKVTADNDTYSIEEMHGVRTWEEKHGTK
jgi:broad specificity phosphatase PhoE